MIFDADGAHPAEVVAVDMAKNAEDGGGPRYAIRLRTSNGDEILEAEQVPITTIALASPNQILIGAPVGDGIVSHCFHSPTRFLWNGEVCYGYTERSYPL